VRRFKDVLGSDPIGRPVFFTRQSPKFYEFPGFFFLSLKNGDADAPEFCMVLVPFSAISVDSWEPPSFFKL